MTKEKRNYALRPDAQSFDEIRIKVVPRFKESELSGSEWRIGMGMEFYRKGELIHSDSVGGNMENAAAFLYSKLIQAVEEHGKGYYAGDGLHCDQEGCVDIATVTYRIKKRYCVGGGKCGQEKKKYDDQYRCFCDKHKHRGDQDLEDNDANYELVVD